MTQEGDELFNKLKADLAAFKKRKHAKTTFDRSDYFQTISDEIKQAYPDITCVDQMTPEQQKDQQRKQSMLEMCSILGRETGLSTQTKGINTLEKMQASVSVQVSDPNVIKKMNQLLGISIDTNQKLIEHEEQSDIRHAGTKIHIQEHDKKTSEEHTQSDKLANKGVNVNHFYGLIGIVFGVVGLFGLTVIMVYYDAIIAWFKSF